MSTETASPPAAEPAAAGGQQPADQPATEQTQQPEGQQAEGEQKAEDKPEDPPRKEKTPEEREIQRLRRRVDNLTRRLYQNPAQQPDRQHMPSDDGTTARSQADDESLTLSRKQLQELIAKEAEKAAPRIAEQRAQIEQRAKVVEGLERAWGKEKFDQYAADLADAFDGLTVGTVPKPATDAIFEADDPRRLIEYLADPEHADEASAIARMGPVQAGRAIAKLETKLAAEKATKRPQPSNAPAPIEPVRGRGTINAAPDPSNTKAWIAWRNEQEWSRRGK